MKKGASVSWFSPVIMITGLVAGVLGALLVKWGNPANMGICVACFVRDIAGGIGLHSAAVVQYIRPEIIGFVLGAFLSAGFTNEFKAQGGSSPVLRFLLGALMMIGALMFLGCPLRMVLRLAGGDLNAVLGLAGFIAGIAIGVVFLKSGFVLSRAYPLARINGWVMPLAMVGLLALVMVKPGFIFFSKQGPGSQHAALLVSLGVGLLVGVLAQRSRFCFAAGVRDKILLNNSHLLVGFVLVFIAALLANVALKQFHLGFANQPVAHTSHVWNFLGLLLVGLSAVLLGGCPLRQLILTGEGNTDSGITFLGMLAGAGFAHNFLLASSPKGPTLNGQIAVIAGIIFCLIIGYANREE
ncbi:MAG: YedE family putative selenium transporter [Candidatus Omnitrophica bacterium]|nr:YedE family putative selenium transporter [Candidatus Omnitrophota bacterium]